jgi:hypothetical protein
MSEKSRLKLAGILLVALGVLLLAWRQYGPAYTPPPQLPLEALTAANLHDVRDAFNADPHQTRVILLFSPT